MIRAAVIGATGYGGGELLRLLLRHPHVDLRFATSRTEQGRPVASVHLNLHGHTDLTFSSPTHEELIQSVDVVIGALPHRVSAEVLAPFIEAGLRVIDLSGDFRLRDMDAYRTFYKREHPRPDLMSQVVYGCPELNREAIRTARVVASPGCFATALNLSLLPVATDGVLVGRPVITAMTGSSGSGASASPGTHHPTRAQTLRPYKVLHHQHVPEVLQLLGDAGSPLEGLDFTPVSAPIVRGILAISVAELSTPGTTDELVKRYQSFYAAHPFVRVVTELEPQCATIAGTNYVDLRVRATQSGELHVACAIDNLIKGGAGQGVQSMNLMFGLDEEVGLDWSGMWP